MADFYIASFPLLEFAKICARITGAKVHQSSSGTYTLTLSYGQQQKWNEKKKSLGITKE